MSSAYLRLAQLVTAVLVAVLLGIHMVIMHLNDILEFFGVGTPDPTTWEPMISRANQSIWVALYIALLAVGIYHALYGLRGIIVELAPSARTTRIVTFAIIASGIIFFIGGTYVPIALLSS